MADVDGPEHQRDEPDYDRQEREACVGLTGFPFISDQNSGGKRGSFCSFLLKSQKKRGKPTCSSLEQEIAMLNCWHRAKASSIVKNDVVQST